MNSLLQNNFVHLFRKFPLIKLPHVKDNVPLSSRAMSGKENENGTSAAAASLPASPPKKVPKSLNICKFVKQEEVASGKWLRLNNITFEDPKGQQRVWEGFERTTKREKSAADAVVMVTTLKRLLHYDCLICVKQYRPPIKAYTLEFPAGLIDESETPEEAALRELKEETGFVGTVKHCSPAVSLDAGTENSTVILVTVEVDGDDVKNKSPKIEPEDGEFIEVLHIPTSEFLERVNEIAASGVIVDARVYTYAICLAQMSKEKRVEQEQK